MRDRREPTPLGDVLRGVLDRLGIGDLDQWQRLRTEWEQVAGAPWDRQAVPLALTDGVLVVEAVTPAAVGVLRYGVASLKHRLCEAYGPDIVKDVRIRAPRAGRRP